MKSNGCHIIWSIFLAIKSMSAIIPAAIYNSGIPNKLILTAVQFHFLTGLCIAAGRRSDYEVYHGFTSSP